MAAIGAECRKGLRGTAVIWAGLLVLACAIVSAQEDLEQVISKRNGIIENSYFTRIISFLQQSRDIFFRHVWPDMEFGWRIVLGTVIGFFGAALGSIGGVGGGGIFVPMLTLIIGFDPKTSTAISKCMITGAAVATVYYNLKLRHPSRELPIIDYDLALLFQPMLVLGISIGVIFNVIFAEWMVTVLLILLFIGTSTKAFFKGVETWKKETIIKKVSIIDNVYWKKLSILIVVWLIILLLHISKVYLQITLLKLALLIFSFVFSFDFRTLPFFLQDYTATCSAAYWTVTLLQIPVAVGASGYQAVCLYKGWKVIESKGETENNWTVHQLILCCFCGILAGIVGGLLGLGGGFILGPLFLELGIPPQVSSATTTLVMMFSSSMSVIQYYLLRRFPPSYALYFVVVATFAALVGQHVVRKMVGLAYQTSLEKSKMAKNICGFITSVNMSPS
ncbi:hypothetical protein DH2020_041265 [Rehmannia glutinosa]|uniref:Sulfite exporter TauE/SafE family protein n=1 Tax=Rehmannia glutinosa TaxID=99300 RepID=A0ABR0USM8_REHGL